MQHLQCVGFLFFTLLLPAITEAAPAPPKKVRLRSYRPKAGDVYRVTIRQTQKMEIATQQGQVMQRRQMTQETDYQEKILVVNKKGQITLRERIYKRCVVFAMMAIGMRRRRMPWTCGLVGRTLQIKGTRGLSVAIRVKDKRPLKPRDRRFVRRSLARTYQDRLMPRKAMAVGERWSLDLKRLLRQLPLPPNSIDRTKIAAQGILVKLHKGNPTQATIHMDVTVPLIAFPRYKQAKGMIRLRSKGRAAIGGRSPQLNTQAKTHIELKGLLQTRRGTKRTQMTVKSYSKRIIQPIVVTPG